MKSKTTRSPSVYASGRLQAEDPGEEGNWNGSHLVDFQWKLGMAVSSDSCRSLKYPYVAVLLKVADHSGQVKNKSFEMTIPQFQNFYRQFKEIAAVIETV
ncbi:COMM domain-containing protein 6 isoform X1 [Hyaena hyaena]|uniref:COMM domain-containing protein 6 isoform X1 n=1 Tax=Hyaena hyaena TaxID=95912 RepID=UPI001923209B|nr:COMM domain-containing protein 6 isoform X1 [Hyaena hyaena]